MLYNRGSHPAPYKMFTLCEQSPLWDCVAAPKVQRVLAGVKLALAHDSLQISPLLVE